MNRWYPILIIAILLAGCSTSSDSGPGQTPAFDVDIEAPTSMYKDDLQSVSVSISHPDGIDGTVSYFIGGKQQFEKVLDGEARWDTVFVSNINDPALDSSAADLDETTQSRMEYHLQSNSETLVQADGGVNITLEESLFFEGPIPARNVITDEDFSGVVVFQQDGRTATLDEGITRGMKVRKDDLRSGQEVLVQADGYKNLRDVLQLTDSGIREVAGVPESTRTFDFNVYVDFLHEQKKPDEDGVFQPTGNYVIWSYPKGSTIAVHCRQECL